MPSTPYTPTPISSFTSFEEVSRYLQVELQRVSAGVQQAESGYQEVFYVAPIKPREGMLAYTDGTSWNPGSGAGLYEYVNSVWRRVNPVISDASTTVKGIVELATDAETQAGTDAIRATTPASIASIPKAWPIGAVFIAVVNTNPNVLLGYGTWVAFGTGRTLVGIDTGQTEFDVVEEIGGAKTHTLTVAEMPAHTHPYSLANAPTGGSGAGSLYAETSTKETGSVGGGAAHNNLQPYIVVYMWKRTA